MDPQNDIRGCRYEIATLTQPTPGYDLYGPNQKMTLATHAQRICGLQIEQGQPDSIEPPLPTRSLTERVPEIGCVYSPG